MNVPSRAVQAVKPNIQEIIVGRKIPSSLSVLDNIHGDPLSMHELNDSHGESLKTQHDSTRPSTIVGSKVETVVYKTVGDLSIHADIHHPPEGENGHAKSIGKHAAKAAILGIG